MRKNAGTLNAQLSRVFSELGHTDQIVVSSTFARALAAARCWAAMGAETAWLSSCCTWKRSGE